MASDTSASISSSTTFSASWAYRYYVAWLLCGMCMLSFADRYLLAILAEPIRKEFAISDFQMGLLTGLAFAVVHALTGIPIGRLADRHNRVTIIAIAAALWSSFTALTGFARNYLHLFAARMSIGITEAGCGPPAYSIISDYFPRHKRATALGIYHFGIYGGIFVGFLLGGFLAEKYGWRNTFLFMGLPGVLMAVLLKVTVREPPRGFADATEVKQEPPNTQAVIKKLWSKKTFRHLSLACALHAFVNTGTAAFMAPFLMRTHGISIADAGMLLATVNVIGGVAGTYLAGMLADRCAAQKNDIRWYLWITAIALVIGVPPAIVAYWMNEPLHAAFILLIAVALGASYLPPTIATAHLLVTPRERAVTGAVVLMIVNLLGMGLGSPAVGLVSDLFEAKFLASGLSDVAARADGLRWAISLAALVNLWSAYHYWRAARTVREEAQ